MPESASGRARSGSDPRRGRRSPRRVVLLAGSLTAAVALAFTSFSNPPARSEDTSAVNASPDGSDAAGRRPLPHATTPTHGLRAAPRVPVDGPALTAEVQAAASVAGGEIAVVVVGADGEPLLSGPHQERPVYTASLVKMLVVAEVLALSQAGEIALAPDDMLLMERALTSSDDSAMSALWVRYDGADRVTDASARSSLTGTAPPAERGQWGESLMSAADVATFLSGLGDVYGAAVAGLLTDWLRAATPVADDGFDQLFGLLSPAGGAAGSTAAKQGWMCCVDDRRQLHSAGLLADGRAVVLLGDFPDGTPWSAASDALDSAAAIVTAGTANRG